MKPQHPLQPLIDIHRGDRVSRLIVIIGIPTLLIFGAFCFYMAQASIEKDRAYIYTLVDGKALQLAVRTDEKQNKPVEIKDNAKVLMMFIFNVSPDADALKTNLDHAKKMGDVSIENFIKTLNEGGYYNNLLSIGAIQTLELDSAKYELDVAQYPYTLKVECKQRIVRPSNVTIKNLICKMNMLNVPRTEVFTHGLYIENFSVISNKTLSSYERTKE